MFEIFKRPSRSAQPELARTVALAFQLARQSGRTVFLAPEPGPRRLAPRMDRHVRFGLPAGLPLPPGTLDPRWSQGPKALMVSPWDTATEGMWFLQDDQGALCMHLSAKGRVRFLRYRPGSRDWKEA